MTPPLRIAIVHYHLRPGGVTTVIAAAVEALHAAGARTAVLTGGPAPEPRLLEQHVLVDGLNYAAAENGSVQPTVLASRLRDAARQALDGPPDLWHFHNHSIGKSCALPAAVRLLAADGEKLLLQIHDFAEDGRPANYQFLLNHLGQGDPGRLAGLLYPQGPHIHYAALNARDRGFLCAAGMPPDRVHLLPNAIGLNHLSAPEANHGAGPRLFLYPTRAIRRKNLGEFLLWSALARTGDRFASTLAPTSPADRTAYDRWVAFAAAEHLPVDFGIGMKRDVPMAELLASAHAVLSTSIAEGFGLAFLEPWLAHRPLFGRDIPDITAGFRDEGLDLTPLYTRLLVPLEIIGGDTLRSRIAGEFRSLLAKYNRTAQEADIDAAFAAAVHGEAVDFGRLNEELQEIVIRAVCRNPGLRSAIQPPALHEDGHQPALIRHNASVVRSTHGLAQYGERLARVYGLLRAAQPAPLDSIQGGKLLDSFLAPERFFLLRT